MTMTGNAAVDAADIAPAVQQFKDMLIQKNVAADIAESITTAVCDSLVGQKISGIHGVKAAAKDAMEEALTKILTPKQSIDILSEIFMEKQRGNPYIICFVGVNGVGKSTTLAKVLTLSPPPVPTVSLLCHEPHSRSVTRPSGLPLHQRKPVLRADCRM